MKRFFKIVFTALFIFFLFTCGDNKVVNAEDENSIFSFNVDGYWKPSDEKSHDFYIKNNFGKKCYLESLSFNNTLIEDIETNKKYTLEEAKKCGIIEAYNIILSLNDDKYGNTVLYNGKLKDMDKYTVSFPHGLYMDKDSEIKFNILITMDSKAGNEYQNKHYIFSIVPKYFEVKYSVDGDRENRRKYFEDKNGYYDENGNYVVNGYYDEDGNWHNGYYYDKDGVRHEMNPFSDGLNRVNKYFKTGQGIISIMGYEILFITCCFFVMYRIRQRQNVL